jgi:hypothetical protein
MVEPLSFAAPPRTSVIAAGILPTTRRHFACVLFDCTTSDPALVDCSLFHCSLVHFRESREFGAACNEQMNNHQ